MYYVDTSAFLPYTLTRKRETTRYEQVKQLFVLSGKGQIQLATSLYAFIEIYIFALEKAPDIQSASDVAKEAILSILQTPILLLPLPTRIERSIFSHRLSALHDASDLSHAISALVNGCAGIIAYDEHFQQICHFIPCKTPEQVLYELSSKQSKEKMKEDKICVIISMLFG